MKIKNNKKAGKESNNLSIENDQRIEINLYKG